MNYTDYPLDLYGFSNEDGDGYMAVVVDFPQIKGCGDTFEEAESEAYERLKHYLQTKGVTMQNLFDQGVAAYEAKSYAEARRYFEEAAALRHTDAMVNLGLMHLKGQGGERSTADARAWFEQATQSGNTQAALILAHMTETDMYGKPDRAQAMEYYKRAADGGAPEAQFKVGMYLKEQGEVAGAMQYLIAAAHNDNPHAQELITYVSNAGIEPARNTLFRSLESDKQRALIENMIQTKIRPTLEADSGGIELVNYTPGDVPQVWLHYLGACSGCHLGSTSTADMLLDRFEELIDKNIVLYLM
jgi:uncharacterized protein